MILTSMKLFVPSGELELRVTTTALPTDGSYVVIWIGKRPFYMPGFNAECAEATREFAQALLDAANVVDKPATKEEQPAGQMLPGKNPYES